MRLLPEERVCQCGRRIVGGEVLVMKHGDRESFYGNLYTCGSVWVCAVCAAKITERRRVELVGGVEAWKATGGTVYLLTLTAPHYATESTTAVLRRFTDARRRLLNGKAYRTAMRPAGLVGSVRALEITYGVHGAHVHSHEILFCTSITPPDPEALLTAWQGAVTRSGGKAPNGHGLKLDDGSKAGEYATKWGMAEELTKAHIKKGKDGGKTPWDLLRDAMSGDKKAGRLFVEFAHAFRGKRQLVWSKGMRDLLRLGQEKTDEEVASEVVAEAVRVAAISPKDWRVVLANDMQCEILEAADEGGAEAVFRLIERVRC
jgi:hypothetical protein